MFVLEQNSHNNNNTNKVPLQRQSTFMYRRLRAIVNIRRRFRSVVVPKEDPL